VKHWNAVVELKERRFETAVLLVGDFKSPLLEASKQGDAQLRKLA
jgi:hypothetical protein